MSLTREEQEEEVLKRTANGESLSKISEAFENHYAKKPPIRSPQQWFEWLRKDRKKGGELSNRFDDALLDFGRACFDEAKALLEDVKITEDVTADVRLAKVVDMKFRNLMVLAEKTNRKRYGTKVVQELDVGNTLASLLGEVQSKRDFGQVKQIEGEIVE